MYEETKSTDEERIIPERLQLHAIQPQLVTYSPTLDELWHLMLSA